MATEVWALPQYAPLSTPMVLDAFLEQLRRSDEASWRSLGRDAEGVKQLLHQATQRIQLQWKLFDECIRQKRGQAFSLLSDFVEHNEISIASLKKLLLEYCPTRSGKRQKQNLSEDFFYRLRQAGVLRSHTWGRADADSALASVTMRLFNQRLEQGYLPVETIMSDEPNYYCYSQLPPGQSNGVLPPVVPCPVPFPTNLPRNTLLWLPSEAVFWDETWMKVGPMAFRWPSIDENGQWNLNASELEAWVPDLVRLGTGLFRSSTFIRKPSLQSFASTALVMLAEARMEPNFHLASNTFSL